MSEVPPGCGPHRKAASFGFRLIIVWNICSYLSIVGFTFFSRGWDSADQLWAEKRIGAHAYLDPFLFYAAQVAGAAPFNSMLLRSSPQFINPSENTLLRMAKMLRALPIPFEHETQPFAANHFHWIHPCCLLHNRYDLPLNHPLGTIQAYVLTAFQFHPCENTGNHKVAYYDLCLSYQDIVLLAHHQI